MNILRTAGQCICHAKSLLSSLISLSRSASEDCPLAVPPALSHTTIIICSEMGEYQVQHKFTTVSLRMVYQMLQNPLEIICIF